MLHIPVFLTSIFGFNAIPKYIAQTILKNKPEVFVPCVKSFHETTKFRTTFTLALDKQSKIIKQTIQEGTAYV